MSCAVDFADIHGSVFGNVGFGMFGVLARASVVTIQGTAKIEQKRCVFAKSQPV